MIIIKIQTNINSIQLLPEHLLIHRTGAFIFGTFDQDSNGIIFQRFILLLFIQSLQHSISCEICLYVSSLTCLHSAMLAM